jgi:hypothetical protein
VAPAGIDTAVIRDQLPAAATRSAPSDALGFDHHCVIAPLNQLQGGRRAGEAYADDAGIALQALL